MKVLTNHTSVAGRLPLRLAYPWTKAYCGIYSEVANFSVFIGNISVTWLMQ